jgi:hypothetical protein
LCVENAKWEISISRVPRVWGFLNDGPIEEAYCKRKIINHLNHHFNELI